MTVTRSGDLDPGARFFTTGDIDKLVYCETSGVAKASEVLSGTATVIDAGQPLDLNLVLADLAGRGIRRLMVEGGTQMHTTFLTTGLADEIHLVIAPFFIGDPDAPRFVNAGQFPNDPTHPLSLNEVQRIGEVVYLNYQRQQ